MAEAFELVILGGGCAGLSLSMALAVHGGRCPRTLVIESRTEYANDRTWCYWKDPSVPAPYQVQHRWQSMRVAHAGQSVLLDCGSQPCAPALRALCAAAPAVKEVLADLQLPGNFGNRLAEAEQAECPLFEFCRVAMVGFLARIWTVVLGSSLVQNGVFFSPIKNPLRAPPTADPLRRWTSHFRRAGG